MVVGGKSLLATATLAEKAEVRVRALDFLLFDGGPSKQNANALPEVQLLLLHYQSQRVSLM